MLAADETSREAQNAFVLSLRAGVVSPRDSLDTASQVERRPSSEVGVLAGQGGSGASHPESARVGFHVVARFLLERRAQLLSRLDVH